MDINTFSGEVNREISICKSSAPSLEHFYEMERSCLRLREIVLREKTSWSKLEKVGARKELIRFIKETRLNYANTLRMSSWGHFKVPPGDDHRHMVSRSQLPFTVEAS